MTQPARSHDLPMEEILASIRRMIEPQESASVAAESPQGNASAPPQANEPSRQEIDRADIDAMLARLHGPSAQIPMPQPAEPARGPVNGGAGLMSPAANAAVNDAFEELARTVAAQKEIQPAGSGRPAYTPTTLEDFVGEMLRPMLRAWLDENLPELVERLV